MTLHSTMFLLILANLTESTVACATLHSTMFLLILELFDSVSEVVAFTFHDVSINTPF